MGTFRKTFALFLAAIFIMSCPAFVFALDTETDPAVNDSGQAVSFESETPENDAEGQADIDNEADEPEEGFTEELAEQGISAAGLSPDLPGVTFAAAAMSGEMVYAPVALPYSDESASLTNEDGLALNGNYGKGYCFTGKAGETVTITMISYDFDSCLFLLDEYKDFLEYRDSTGVGGTEKIVYELPYSGEYYVEASQWAMPDPGYSGSFRISIEVIEISEVVYTPVTLPYSGTGTLTASDGWSKRDTYFKGYSFEANEGQEVAITLTSADFDAYLYLLDENKNVLKYDDDGAGNGNSKIVQVLPYTGTYYIQASQYSQASGDFQITAEALEITVITYAPVSLPYCASDALSAKDGRSLRNMYGKGYYFNADAGQKVTITLSSDDFYPYLYLLDEDKNVLDYSGHTITARIEYTIAVSGLYYVEATQWVRQSPGVAGDYQISIEANGALETGKPGDDPDTVYTEAELNGWLESHVNTGGTVYVKANITLTDSIMLNYYDDDPPEIIIDTGEYGLVYNGGYMFLPSYAFIGEGVDTPVLTVIDPAAFRSAWYNVVQSLRVTATGRMEDGVLIGGTAVRVTQGDNWRPDIDLFHT